MTTSTSILAEVQALDALGWNLVDAPEGRKLPKRSWRSFRTDRTTPFLTDWFGGGGANIFLICGAVSGVVVLDIDSDDAEEYWRERGLASWMDTTACAVSGSGRGHHYYGKLPAGMKIRSRSGDGWDLKGEGGGVIVPPSLHESGERYHWVRRPEQHLLDLPPLLGGLKVAGQPAGPTLDDEPVEPRSMLAALLGRPPVEGGRNEWLAKVCGHYAKLHHGVRDAYEMSVGLAATLLRPPLDTDEIDKTLDSIWRAEHENNSHRSQLGPETGYLVGTGRTTKVRIKMQGVEGVANWANFDLEALGYWNLGEEGMCYRVMLHHEDGHDFDTVLPSRTLSDPGKLRSWLFQYRGRIVVPDGVNPKSMDHGTRLAAYLDSQDPPTFTAASCLGWDGEGYLTHDERIDEDGRQPFKDRRPRPDLRNWAHYHYGFCEPEQARQTLVEVLTFHEPEITSVFGAWWAASLLKPRVQPFVAGFPVMALEGSSETGKSVGFFALMMELAGSLDGPQLATVASTRDALSAHNSAPVWLDDFNDPRPLYELLRQATVGGVISKKGEDNRTQVTVRLVAPLVLSGEGLGLTDQKALADRAVLLDVPSPTKRQSLKGSYPQWDDIVALRAKHPSLTHMAGTIVQLALQQAHQIEQITQLRDGAGRFQDKLAVVRLGARILAAMTGHGHHVEIVDRWAENVRDLGSENALTLQVLPDCLARTGWPTRPMEGDRMSVTTPAFIADRRVWFNTRLLAMWWAEQHREPGALRTHTKAAFDSQAAALGVTSSTHGKRYAVNRGRTSKVTYLGLSEVVSASIIGRARGENAHGFDAAEQRSLELEVHHEQPK